MKLLHIDSSVLAEHSVSRQLTARIVTEWQATHPGTAVEYLDLAQDTPATLSGAELAARMTPADSRSAEQTAAAARTEAFLQQFLAADVIVVGAPMYNFSIPSQLKNWIDCIAQAGRTFKYTETGPVGLAGNKTVIVASSRGGVYSTSEALRALDHQESYLRTVLGFMGIDNVRIVRAEGVNQGADRRSQALAAAEADIATLV
ncbi:NAD(P)H-dependent oxidoreductase [Laribacter hongkongensis]|uniref:FMN dependent NADH:quinone oxidoreductase n=1 Tax=Laribacter hongkongensis TaxID=168471 RepID=A0ABD4SU29_9NEIS|nr:NAD(P)H-dependent oxidoreductase [Laribacter hongkongensis]MCG8993533.1 NAD(P)H-dependent oxidoreductase [Laribacter hongkongensis]MCG8999481.1 NAD(P)H-dependent oxidoreductase [Laribacter hongkongensis]MCG9002520.1 NAD(P)H-dependent oxidoreductase [Laribacter hongkongensis]MCG9005680.1 NAD(P)H-dependent oxidoreductase [Laribacter hongkongensis]MCG9008396.1 NAD(P)H-dependent oxidoreductase [Laribacter hongkongensis]